jgi:hypothetical protein
MVSVQSAIIRHAMDKHIPKESDVFPVERLKYGVIVNPNNIKDDISASVK